MHKLAPLLLLFVSLAINLHTQGDETSAPESLETTVKRLVHELDAPKLASREGAEKHLVELGSAAIPFLPPSQSVMPVEMGQRLARIRARISTLSAETAIAENTGDVRLGDAATLGSALEAISRDSGIEFECQANLDKPITPYPTPLSFWYAIDYVLDQAKLDIDFYGGDSKTLSLQPRQADRPGRVDSAAYVGLYRLEPTIVTSRRTLRDLSLSGMNVELEISWKPDAHPVGITLPLSQITAKLDDGVSIYAQQPDGTIDVAPSNDLPMIMVQLPLELPAGRPTKIESLSGQIQSLLPGEIKQFEFPLNVAAQTQTVDNVTVALEQIRTNGPLHELRIGVQFKSPGKAMESHRGWLLENKVHVVMADGSKRDHLGYELYRHNESGIGIGYLFDIGDSLAEAKLIYSTPTAVIENQIDFVIQDILLP